MRSELQIFSLVTLTVFLANARDPIFETAPGCQYSTSVRVCVHWCVVRLPDSAHCILELFGRLCFLELVLLCQVAAILAGDT